MLKKKIQFLVAKEGLGEQNSFEIIYDSNAAQILGGAGTCPKLVNCSNYAGFCPNLATCGVFTPPDE